MEQKLICEQVKSIDTKDGVLWAYITDNKIIDQAFMTWKELYEILAKRNES